MILYAFIGKLRQHTRYPPCKFVYISSRSDDHAVMEPVCCGEFSIKQLEVDAVMSQEKKSFLKGMLNLLPVRRTEHFFLKGGSNLKPLRLKERLYEDINVFVTVYGDHVKDGCIFSRGIWFMPIYSLISV